jgi:hypothetical protein
MGSSPRANDNTAIRDRIVAATGARLFRDRAACALIAAVAIVFRVWRLGNLPGISGDEAWYGVRTLAWLHHGEFTWRTPSGLPMSLWHLVSLALAHLIHADPSPWVLRIPSLSSGLLLVVLAYPLLRRVLGHERAVLGFMLICAAPALIAYARLSWDISHGSFIVLLGIYFSLRGRLWPALLAYALAVETHPTFACSGAIIFAPMVAAAVARRRERVISAKGVVAAIVGCAVAVFAALTLLHTPATDPWAARLGLVIEQSRYALAQYVDLFSGATAYRYIAGPVSMSLLRASHVAGWGMGGILLFVGLRNLLRRSAWAEISLVLGWIVAAAIALAIAGPRELAPGMDRHSFWLVFPGCLAAAILIHATGESLRAHRLQFWGTAALCAALLCGFWPGYFEPLLTTGGQGERGFRTGPLDPKLAAWQAIEADMRSSQHPGEGRPRYILAEDWWCGQPLRYFAFLSGDTAVTWGEGAATRRVPASYLVGFPGGPFAQEAARRDQAPWLTIWGYDGKPALLVWRNQAP